MEEITPEDCTERDLRLERHPTSLGFLVTDIALLLREKVRECLVGTDLTTTKGRALVCVARFEGIRQTELAKKLDLQLIHAVKLVDQLISEGLLVRNPDPEDRRAYRLSIAPGAASLLRKLKRIFDHLDDQALAGLDADERAAICQALLKIRQNLS